MKERGGNIKVMANCLHKMHTENTLEYVTYELSLKEYERTNCKKSQGKNIPEGGKKTNKIRLVYSHQGRKNHIEMSLEKQAGSRSHKFF